MFFWKIMMEIQRKKFAGDLFFCPKFPKFLSHVARGGRLTKIPQGKFPKFPKFWQNLKIKNRFSQFEKN